MGNGTKVALVALLILMVVVIARFVRDDSAPADGPALAKAGTPSSGAGKAPARPDGKSKATLPSVAEKKGSAQRTGTQGGPPQGTATGAAGPVMSANLPSGSRAGLPAQGGAAAAPGSEPSGGSAASQFVGPRPPVEGYFTPIREPVAGAPGSQAQPGAGTGQGSPPISIGVQRDQSSMQDAQGGATDLSDGSRSPPTRKETSGGTGNVGGGTPPREGDVALRPVVTGEKDTTGDGGRGSGGGIAPAPTPQKPAARETTAEGFPKTHLIVKADTYWGLAKEYYGRASTALAAHIQKANADVKLRPGKKLVIPAPPEGFTFASAKRVTDETEIKRNTLPPSRDDGRSEKPASDARRQSPPTAVAVGPQDYVVQEGDTLMKIAKKVYGDATLFHLIEDANGNLKYQVLRAGSKIHIPARR